MKLFTAFLVAASLVATPALAATHNWKVIRVMDGDTIEVEAPWVPTPLKPVIKIRVLGVDTPEKGGRAQCPKEAAGGEAATNFTKSVIKPGQVVQVDLQDWDKFGGRVLGYVKYNGKDLTQELIKGGFARAYMGEKKASWCN
jgi:micrococcal nuclease